MSNSLREACGEEAKDILVALVCAFPAIYSYRCHNRSKYELTTRELKEAFEFVVGSMRQEYGSKVTTELCWASWCSIRYNYVRMLRSTGEPPMKWEQKLSILKSCPDIQRELTHRRVQSVSERPLVTTFGKNCVIFLLRKIGAHTCFHSRTYVAKTRFINQLRPTDRLLWDHIVAQVGYKYPGVDKDAAWRCWRNIRLTYNSSSYKILKWLPYLGFLGSRQVKESRSSEADTLNEVPPRTTRFAAKAAALKDSNQRASTSVCTSAPAISNSESSTTNISLSAGSTVIQPHPSCHTETVQCSAPHAITYNYGSETICYPIAGTSYTEL